MIMVSRSSASMGEAPSQCSPILFIVSPFNGLRVPEPYYGDGYQTPRKLAPPLIGYPPPVSLRMRMFWRPLNRATLLRIIFMVFRILN